MSPHILAEDTTVRKFLMLPFAALLLTLALNDSSAQSPSKVKAKPPEADTSAAGLHFEVYRDSGDKYRYRIKDGDTQIGMASKGYETKDEVKKIIETIQKGAARAKVVEEKASSDSKSK
jgi:uncharacterized protein YegP (UPF0339 family)